MPPRPSSSASSLLAALTAAVDAATAGDLERFDGACAALARASADHADTVLSTCLRELLEQLHPDGLDGEGIRAVLGACVDAAAGWLADLDVTALVVVLSGALGIAEAPVAGDLSSGEPSSDEPSLAQPLPDEVTLRRHAIVLTASLCTQTGTRPGRYLAGALAEIERAETQEMP